MLKYKYHNLSLFYRGNKYTELKKITELSNHKYGRNTVKHNLYDISCV